MVERLRRRLKLGWATEDEIERYTKLMKKFEIPEDGDAVNEWINAYMMRILEDEGTLDKEEEAKEEESSL